MVYIMLVFVKRTVAMLMIRLQDIPIRAFFSTVSNKINLFVQIILFSTCHDFKTIDGALQMLCDFIEL
jgi:hypothetical protein